MTPLAPGALLAQSQPGDTATATLFTATIKTQMNLLVVTNVTGTAATFRLHHDAGGTTFDSTNALYYGKSVAANDSVTVNFADAGIELAAGDSLGIQAGTASALTFSAYGVVAPQR